MKTTAISMALAAVLLAISASASAQSDDRGRAGPGNWQGSPRGDGHGPGDRPGGPGPGHAGPGGQGGPGPGGHGGPGGRPDGPDRRPDYRGGNDRGHYAPSPGYAHGHGYGRPDPAPMRWGRGDRVPLPYRGRSYVIDDWHGHRLHAPPRGYEWISTGADYFLIGIATGIVLESVFAQ